VPCSWTEAGRIECSDLVAAMRDVGALFSSLDQFSPLSTMRVLNLCHFRPQSEVMLEPVRVSRSRFGRCLPPASPTRTVLRFDPVLVDLFRTAKNRDSRS